VRTVWREQQPGYLEIHRDMVERRIPVPRAIIDWDGALAFRRSDERKVEEAVREAAARFHASRRPLTMVGIETFRFKLQREVRELAERMGAPVTTTVLAKGAFPMDHPLYMGVHIGPISPRPIVERVDGADLVLNLGTLLTDMNLGSRPPSRATCCSRGSTSGWSATAVTWRRGTTPRWASAFPVRSAPRSPRGSDPSSSAATAPSR